ncbi:DUF2231 domain-containing protein [Actinoplanes sp. NPDC049118]|uniref:DUF2231 domain-containing protein n=1 Tax=Actinoplanes sp. NPDC049118 TaxID=3155769 RepID=UPI0033EF0152
MESRLRVADNAVHPLLLMFPLGLLANAVIFDVATLAGAPGMLATLAFWNIVAGLAGGVPAISVAIIDIPPARQGRAARAGTVGVLLDLCVLIVFAVVALIRLRTPDRGADAGLLLVEVIGLAAAGAGTWFGGRLGPRRPSGAGRARPAPAAGPRAGRAAGPGPAADGRVPRPRRPAEPHAVTGQG